MPAAFPHEFIIYINHLLRDSPKLSSKNNTAAIGDRRIDFKPSAFDFASQEL
jgi:hypothetical protein